MRKTIKYKRRNKNHSKLRKSLLGGTDELVNCVMCGKKCLKSQCHNPMGCHIKHKGRAHCICKDCWWNPVYGFALENSKHQCPGCKNYLPLNGPSLDGTIVDLTEDD